MRGVKKRIATRINKEEANEKTTKKNQQRKQQQKKRNKNILNISTKADLTTSIYSLSQHQPQKKDPLLYILCCCLFLFLFSAPLLKHVMLHRNHLFNLFNSNNTQDLRSSSLIEMKIITITKYKIK